MDRTRNDKNTRVALITGAGNKAFCTGSDLKKAMPPTESHAELLLEHNNPGYMLHHFGFDELGICAVNGYAVGGRLELALACDNCIAADNAITSQGNGSERLCSGRAQCDNHPHHSGSAGASREYEGNQVRTKELGIAVVGSGRIGSLRAQMAAGHPAVRFLAVSDLSADRAAALTERTGAVFSSADNLAVIAHPKVNAVIVSTSEHKHLEPVMQALELGKPVLVEKPTALTLGDADKIIAKSESTGTPLHVGYALITYENGAVVNLGVYFALPAHAPQLGMGVRIEVFGSEVALLLIDDHTDELLITNKGIPHAYIPGLQFQTAFLSSSTPGNWHMGDYWGPVADESRVWHDHLSRNRPCPMATAREARQTLEITLAIEESARIGKAIRLGA